MSERLDNDAVPRNGNAYEEVVRLHCVVIFTLFIHYFYESHSSCSFPTFNFFSSLSSSFLSLSRYVCVSLRVSTHAQVLMCGGNMYVAYVFICTQKSTVNFKHHSLDIVHLVCLFVSFFLYL